MPRLTTLKPKIATLENRIGYCNQPAGLTANQSYDRKRDRESPTRTLYRTARWLALRADQLQREPLCEMCQTDGIMTSATVCDHIHPHRGDVERFWSGPFQSLCAPCHSSRKQRLEQDLHAGDVASPESAMPSKREGRLG